MVGLGFAVGACLVGSQPKAGIVQHPPTWPVTSPSNCSCAVDVNFDESIGGDWNEDIGCPPVNSPEVSLTTGRSKIGV